jgi:hypothetical protein
MNASYTCDPNTTRLATHCVLCQRPLRDAVSVNLGIGPICREGLGLDNVDPLHRVAANRAIHRAGLACMDPAADAVQTVLACADEVETYGLTNLAAKIRDRYIHVQVWRQTVNVTRWDPRTRTSTVLDATHEVVCVRTPYSPEANLNRAEYLRGARPVKVDKDFHWEVPADCQRGLLGWLARNWGGHAGYNRDASAVFAIPTYSEFTTTHRKDPARGWVRV